MSSLVIGVRTWTMTGDIGCSTQQYSTELSLSSCKGEGCMFRPMNDEDLVLCCSRRRVQLLQRCLHPHDPEVQQHQRLRGQVRRGALHQVQYQIVQYSTVQYTRVALDRGYQKSFVPPPRELKVAARSLAEQNKAEVNVSLSISKIMDIK